MSAKTDYIRTHTTTLKSQVESLQLLLGSLMDGIKSAETDAFFRDANAEEPNRANTEAKVSALVAAVNGVNATTLNVVSVSDFMSGYDAAVDPE